MIVDYGRQVNINVDFSTIVSASEAEGEDSAETQELKAMIDRAAAYLRSFKWCSEVLGAYFGLGVGAVVAVCLFKIKPSQPDVDEWLWVIVGDLPPAYLVTDCAPNPAKALNEYICGMREWVRAVKSGTSTADVMPVNAPPTPGNAEDLSGRLDFLEREILSKFYGDQLKG